ncbi:MAG: hypothetical protein HY322_04990 [Betaproteobacteria bacterium]|nr:hypothetical protein [Betaproteobacteria bacterium]
MHCSGLGRVTSPSRFPDAASRESVAVYGTPDEIAEKLEALRAVGVTYLLASVGGDSRESLRRFAREIVPAFAGGKGEAAATARCAEIRA